MKTKSKKKHTPPQVEWTPERREAQSRRIKEAIAAKKQRVEQRRLKRLERQTEIATDTRPAAWATARSKRVNYALATLAIVEMHLSQGRAISPKSSVAEIVGEAVEALAK